jgi:hypothetical protein
VDWIHLALIGASTKLNKGLNISGLLERLLAFQERFSPIELLKQLVWILRFCANH